MNFKETIKEEWEKEFPESIGHFGTSIFNTTYGNIVERICARVWNQAVVHSATDRYNFGNEVETEQSIRELLINEQDSTSTPTSTPQ